MTKQFIIVKATAKPWSSFCFSSCMSMICESTKYQDRDAYLRIFNVKIKLI